MRQPWLRGRGVRFRLLAVGSGLVLVTAAGLMASAPVIAAAPCVAAGASGLTARIVAHAGQKIEGISVNANGCDIGIYVPPHTPGVAIRKVNVSGATDQGILVQDSNGVVIADSTITGNLLNPDVCPFPPAPAPKTPCIVDVKAVELVGSSHSTIENNLIANNLGEGGIGIFDDGLQSPGTLGRGLALPAVGNLISHNRVINNPHGCGIVVSTHVAGQAVENNRVIDNVSIGNAEGVVVADNMPQTKLLNTLVRGNVIADSVAPGIVLNALAPSDIVSGTLVEDNILSANGALPAFEHLPGYQARPTGIIVVTSPLAAGAGKGELAPVQEGVRLVGNIITHESWGIWSTPQNRLTVTASVAVGIVNQL